MAIRISIELDQDIMYPETENILRDIIIESFCKYSCFNSDKVKIEFIDNTVKPMVSLFGEDKNLFKEDQSKYIDLTPE